MYLAQILRNEKRGYTKLIVRLIQNPEIMDTIPASSFRHIIEWMINNIFSESILTVENWMEVAFSLCKQRWDQSIDWLEIQPMSKIRLMISINEKFAEAQEKAIEKAKRKK